MTALHVCTYLSAWMHTTRLVNTIEASKELTCPIRRLKWSALERFMIRHLQVVEVLKLIALLRLKQSKNLISVA